MTTINEPEMYGKKPGACQLLADLYKGIDSNSREAVAAAAEAISDFFGSESDPSKVQVNRGPIPAWAKEILAPYPHIQVNA